MHEAQGMARGSARRARRATIAALLALPALCAPAMAAFPGANGRIAFGAGNEIRTAQPDGSGLRTVTLGSQPAWSADGRKLAYVRDGAIWTVNADGTGATRVSTSPAIADERPSWSPDGSQLAFDRFDFGGIFLVVANADGSGERTIPVGFHVTARDPVWSPDGTRIAFERGPDIGIVNADGTGEPTVIPFTPGPGNVNNYTLHRPDWSPDGSRLVLQRGQDVVGVDGPSDSDIAVVNADGSGLRLVTNDTTPNAEPVWSPDGSKILYNAVGAAFGGDDAFHTINPDGTGDTKLPFGGLSPDWGPAAEACSVPISEQLASLEEDLDELPAGLRRSLTRKLEQTGAAYRAGNPGRARRMLDAFSHEVRAQAGKKIGRADADDLIAAADAIKQAIGC